MIDYEPCPTCNRRAAWDPRHDPDNQCDCIECHGCERMIAKGEKHVGDGHYAFCTEECASNDSERAYQDSLTGMY